MNTRRADVAMKIHKAIRKSLFETALVAGKTDFSSLDEVTGLRPHVDEMILLLRSHGHKEDEHVLPMLKERAPEVVEHDTEDHHRIEAQIDEIETAIAGLVEPGMASDERDIRGGVFFQMLNSFIGEYLLHMHSEETVTAQHMWDNFTDEELLGMTHRIVTSIPPDETMIIMKHMVPAINTPERNELLGAIRAAAPPHVYEQIAAFASAPTAA